MVIKYIYNDFNISDEYLINKDVQIIGISNNKLINCNRDGDVYISNEANVFFENIKFNLVANVDGDEGLIVNSGCGVWINNSIFEYDYNAIFSFMDSIQINIVITNCDIYGSNQSAVAICVQKPGNLNIINCMFINCAEWTKGDEYEAVIQFSETAL
eukprot:459529_1